LRLDLDLGSDLLRYSMAGVNVVISPDGKRIAYVSQNRLFTRRLDQLDEASALELPGTVGAYAPFFSPDGRWIAFFALGILKKISVEGGAPIPVAGASPIARGGSWGEDGNIIIAANTGPLQRVPDTGGKLTEVTVSRAPGDITHRFPQVLPGGKAVLFTAHDQSTGFDSATIDVVSLIDGSRKTVHRGGTYGRYVPSGHLIFVNNGTLFAVPFDIDKLETHGSPLPILNDIAYSASVGVALLDVSQTGTLLYGSGAGGLGRMTVQWLREGQKSEPLLVKPGMYQRPRLSPNGQQLALESTEGANPGVWIYDLLRDTFNPLTTQGRTEGPLWTLNGRLIVFASEGMSWIRADGAGSPQLLTQGKGGVQFPNSFSPDGKFLAFQEATTTSGYDLYVLPIEYGSGILKAGEPKPFLIAPLDQRHAAFSPDGHWIAYTSNQAGFQQIWVRAFPDNGGSWLVGDGQYPLWSKNTHQLFFRGDDNRILVAGYIIQGDTFTSEKPRVWSDKVLANLGQIANYDLASDGSRAIGLVADGADESKTAQNHVTFVLNFFDELRRRFAAQGNQK
jgi:Tol biopolymer transport system component